MAQPFFIENIYKYNTTSHSKPIKIMNAIFFMIVLIHDARVTYAN